MSARLHVYGLDARDAEALPGGFFRWLPDSEWQRIAALRRPEDQANRKMAYAALYWLAHRQAGVPPEQITLCRSDGGKPFLRLPDGVAPLHVSLSHSGHCIVIALGSCPVGVDVERVRPLDAGMLARDYFPRDPLDPHAPPHALLAFWTGKEAALKAVGAGLHIDPATLVLRAPGQGFQPLEDWPPGRGLEAARVASLPMPDGYVAAIAALHPRPLVSMQFLNAIALKRLAKC